MISRILSGLAALVVLVAAVGGVPWLLIIMAGNPLPSDLGPDSLWRALVRPDDGTILIGLVAVIAWIAWLVFTVSVVLELVAAVSRQRIRIRVPGFAGPQKLAAGLVLMVMAIFIAPHQFAAADPVGSDHPAEPTTTTASAPAAPSRPADAVDEDSDDRATADRAADTVFHVVQPGDDLWTLSEHYYGNGQDWRRIARANPALLTGGPDRLQPGWRLRIPDVDPGVHRVRARAGESLSVIAEREYGDADAWHRIYQANRGVLTDPDLLPVGVSLIIPPVDRVGGGGRTGAADHGDAADHQRAAPDGGARQSGRTAGPSERKRPDASTSVDPGRAEPSTAPTATTPAESDSDQGQGTAPAADEAPAGEAAADGLAAHATGFAGIGGLMAAAVIGGLATRRQLQLRTRPVGRRIPQPPAAAQRFEAELGRRQTAQGLDLLDLALRTIGRDCHRQRRPLPRLQAARSADDGLQLLMSESDLPAPAGFVVDGDTWRLAPAAADVLAQDDAADAAQPYPGLTSLGTAPDGAIVMVNLEAGGLVAVSGFGSGGARGLLTAMATELAFSPWADELVVTLAGDDHGLAGSIDRYNVSAVAGLDHLLDRWEQRARMQRDHLRSDPGVAAGDYRIDPDLADPWVPEVGLILSEPDVWQAERLERLLLSDPPVTIAAVVIGDQLMTDWRIIRTSSGGARLEPIGWQLTPQIISEPAEELVTELLDTTGSQQTEPAPWWAADFALGEHAPTRALAGPPSDDQPDVIAAEDQDVSAAAAGAPAAPAPPAAEESSDPSDDVSASGPPDGGRDEDRVDRAHGDPARHQALPMHPDEFPGHRIEPIQVVEPRQTAATISWPSDAVRTTDEPVGELVARSDAEWEWLAPVDRPRASKESVIVPNPFAGGSPQTPRHPTIMLLGPAELLGTAGDPPNRAVMQCIEYCTWLLEHPASTAQAMAAALAVAEGTRRSNMSRLRNWLGSDDRGQPYLPDAYSGRITLSPLVSSDWHRLQLLTHAGVNRTSTEGLAKALDLVRGAPLADAAPGQWHWAEEMRTDMVSVIRDIGVELAHRALADSDIDLARWAAARALTASPQDEFLMAARIRTEHQAGNPAEVERLALQLAAQGRALGVDLHPETVDLLQQVMEGRLRARA